MSYGQPPYGGHDPRYGQSYGQPQFQYTRQQKGHSIWKAVCFDWITCYMRSIYWSCSPNHYWHF